MKILGIIPARFNSSRFPGKPLANIHGKSMIRRVYEQAICATSLHKVIVATDDKRIFDEIESFNGSVILTENTHQSGTDRCAEVARQFPEYDAIVNIQGDEPFIQPEQIDLLVSCFQQPDAEIATLIKRITTQEEMFNTNIPKVVINKQGKAIYFSRSTIPFIRGENEQNWAEQKLHFKHIGMYGYKADVLYQISQLPTSPLETNEQLEQLRWIENGYQIQTAVTDLETIAVDTPNDLIRVIQTYSV